MSRNLSISETGLKLIKAFEGYRPVDRLLVTGIRVVGYGHRLLNDRPVSMNRSQAEQVLRDDLAPFEELVNEDVLAPLNQSQFDALVSLAFNIGPKAFRGSDIVRALNNGRPLDAANGFDVWRTSTINGQTYVVDALLRRRTAEKSLFLRAENLPNAPTALVPPQRDNFFPRLETGDGLPVYTDADPEGSALSVPYDQVDDMQRAREDEAVGTLTLSEVLDVEEDTAPSGPAEDLNDVLSVRVDQVDQFDGSAAPFTETASPVLSSPDVELTDPGMDPEPSEFRPDLSSPTDVNVDDNLAPDTDLSSADSLTGDAEIDTGPEKQSSAIAQAADELRERLDNLIDSRPDREALEPLSTLERSTDIGQWPTSLISGETEPADPARTAAQAGSQDDRRRRSRSGSSNILDDVARRAAEDRAAESRSNLVAFPGATRQAPLPADDSDEANEDHTADLPLPATLAPQSSRGPDILIDELAADDLMRGQGDRSEVSEDVSGAIYDDALDTVEPDVSRAGLWIPILLGFALLGASVAAGLRGSQSLMGNWGPIAVVAGIITGALMVVFSIYISLTQKP